MTDRKKPGVAFWATVMVVVVLAYVLSIGPVEFLYFKLGEPTWLQSTANFIYTPLALTLDNCPEVIDDMFQRYENWWTASPGP